MRLSLAIGMMLLIGAPAFGQEIQPPIDSGPDFIPVPGQSIHDALRHQIESIQAGQPDYDALTSDAAASLRSQIQPIQSDIRKWGALEMLSYQRSYNGFWVYEARFDRAKVDWLIKPMNDQGKITGIGFLRLPLSPSRPS